MLTPNEYCRKCHASNPDRTDVKLHTCGKKIDWVPNRNHASLPQSVFCFERAKAAITAVKLPNYVFLKTIGYNETHHAHAGEELAAVRPRLHSNLFATAWMAA